MWLCAAFIDKIKKRKTVFFEQDIAIFPTKQQTKQLNNRCKMNFNLNLVYVLNEITNYRNYGIIQVLDRTIKLTTPDN